MAYLVRRGPALTFDIPTLTCCWWSIRALLTLMLVFVLIRGIQSARQGDGFAGGLVEA
jgi:hypothetical protein